MQLVYKGAAHAFEVIYDRHSEAAFSLALRICGQRALAEDVTQEAFLSLWRSRARYDRGRGSVRNWVLGIVHNRAIDAIRRRGVRDRGVVHDEGIEAQLPAPERTDLEVARREEAREVRDALGQLPKEQSRVIELAYFGGLTHVEIASLLEHAGRHRQGPYAPRSGEDAIDARTTRGGAAMSPGHGHGRPRRLLRGRGRVRAGGAHRRGARALHGPPRGLYRLPRGGRPACRWRPTRCRSRPPS